ncbi:uncharacterized protein [Dermacentor albipictus]|uniref:uncharacterized protein n=1 Tax=Dermacentor albipictus TaxID=60249 RepID=UPI0038FD1C37
MDFCKVSGAKVNREKCAGAWLGAWDLKPTTFLEVKWKSEIISYLGVCFNTANLQNGQNTIRSGTLAAKVQQWHGRTVPLMNRAFVCNTVFFPAIWYSAQVMPCLPSQVNRVHRFCATYIWESRFERMRRSNLFLSKAKGGLGLVNVEVKLKVHRYLFFKNQTHHIIRHSFKQLGGGYLSEWIEGAQGVPRARTLKFYREVEQAARFFEQRFSQEYLKNVKRKSLYWNTIDMLFPPPLYRSRVGSQLESDVFKRLPKYPVKTAIKDFFVRLHVEVLPVKTWLRNKGFFVPWSTDCPLCPYPESLQHVFLFCTNAVLFWHNIRIVFDVQIYPNWDNVKYLTLADDKNNNSAETLLLLGLYAIWRSRTDYVLALENAKPAWTHFCDAFAYTSSLLGGEDEFSKRWQVWQKRLQQR